MIDQDLINIVESHILDGKNLPVRLSENILDAYISLVNQNAETHKQSEKYKAQIKSLIHCDDMNTGYEPSLSVFQREIDLNKELVGYVEE